MGIVSGLFIGWILGLFGFKGVVIAGMAQLFGVKLSVLGYYFIFAGLGLFSWVVSLFKRPKNVKVDDINKAFNEFKEAVKKL